MIFKKMNFILMQSIKEKQDNIIDDLNCLTDWQEKYIYIIDYANKLPLIDKTKLLPEYEVKGCQSKIWLDIQKNINNTISMYADGNADIPLGLTSMVIDILNNRTVTEIIEADIYFLAQSGVLNYLSPLRQKGIKSVINTIKEKVQNL
jgi:cysteine desulfuration protein SufE